MLSKLNNSMEVLEAAQNRQLYQKMLVQLKKDFALANVEFDISNDVEPSELKKQLHEKLYFLLMERFQDYLKLLYVIDVPESDVKKIKSSDVVDISAEVCFLVLKRVWTKVWFKNKYSA